MMKATEVAIMPYDEEALQFIICQHFIELSNL